MSASAVPPSHASSSASPPPSTSSAAASTSAIPAFLNELLPSSTLSAAYHSKLHNRFLQLAATEPSVAPSTNIAQPAKRQKQRQQSTTSGKKRRGPTGGRCDCWSALTAKQRKQLKLLSLPPSSTALRYSNFLPLHRLWLAYVVDLLSQPHSVLPLSSGERLLKADYHGAKVIVSRSTAASYVHLSGIIIQESASGWRMIGEDDVVATGEEGGHCAAAQY